MKDNFYDGRFIISNVNYKNIDRDFNIYELNIGKNETSDKGETDIYLFKKIRELKNLKSFYKSDKVYLLGDKNFKVESYEFFEGFVRGSIKKLNFEEIENMNKLNLLNLLIKSIPQKIFDRDSNKESYINMSNIYFYLKKEKEGIYKFLKCSFENSKISDDYILRVDQTTIASKYLFKDQKISNKTIKLDFDKGTKILIPSEKGEYYEGNPSERTVSTRFLTTDITKLPVTRSYYFSLMKDIIEEFLSEYIELKFKCLENYEHYQAKGKQIYFKNNFKTLSKVINIYRIKDINKSGKIIISDDDFENIKKDLEELIVELEIDCIKDFKIIDKGIADENTIYSEDQWNIFLLNNDENEEYILDGYKEIKKKENIISNGIIYKKIKEEKSKEKRSKEKKSNKIKVTYKKILEELFIKEQLKNRDITKFHSTFENFEGVSCIQYKNERIRKIVVIEKGKIKVKSCLYGDNSKLNKEFLDLIEKFDLYDELNKEKNKNLEFKFVKINNKDIYIYETGLRLYFDIDKYDEEYDNLNRKAEGFFGRAMWINLNKKEQLYYAFYQKGIKSEERTSPNIKKLISKEEITDDEYNIFCESLVIKYFSNERRIASYPFLFKLTEEIRKDC